MSEIDEKNWKILDPSERCISRFLTTDRYSGILHYSCLCILFVSIKSKLLKHRIVEDRYFKGMGVVMKGRKRMWKNECVSIDLFMSKHYILLKK